MKISVKNFGPIGEAKDIRLSPMTLFVGPSNTGKSYLAVLLYVIAKILSKWPNDQWLNITDKQIKIAKSVIDSADEKNGISASATAKFSQLTKEIFSAWTERISNEFRVEIFNCLGVCGADALSDKGGVEICSEDGQITADLISPQNKEMSASALSATGEKFIKDCNDRELRRYMAMEPDNYNGAIKTALNNYFPQIFVQALWNRFPPLHSYFLPATRGGIIQLRKALMDQAMLQSSFRSDGPDTSAMQTNGALFDSVTADFMRVLIKTGAHLHAGRNAFSLAGAVRDFGSHAHRHGGDKLIEISDALEKDIMRGEIKVVPNDIGFPDFRYNFSGDKINFSIPLAGASAMVSELAPISVFIRHHLGKDDLFIVEEPETNLHPDGQRAIADILARLANAGVFVLATTHSDIVLEQIGNAVRRAGLKNKKTAPKNGGVSLALENAAVYSFDRRVRGKTKVRPVKFDSDDGFGFMTDDHLKASTKLYNETVELMDGADDD